MIRNILAALVAGAITTITQDNVRTILSRNRDRLSSNDGKYWRKPAETKTSEFDELLGGDEPQTENEPTSEVGHLYT